MEVVALSDPETLLLADKMLSVTHRSIAGHGERTKCHCSD